MITDRKTGDPLVLCPYCENAGMRVLLAAAGKKVECVNCRNVYWCQDLIEAALRAETVTKANKGRTETRSEQ